MDGKRSKFDYASFNGGYDDFAVNKSKYSIKEALDLYKQECSLEDGMKVSVTTAFVRHRAGINEDGEPCVGWWLEYEENQRSCPVFAMHCTFEDVTRINHKYDIYVLGVE